jgi:thioredoxin 1
MNTPPFSSDNLTQIKEELTNKTWLVACLCAAWCDTCQSYRTNFDALRAIHTDKCFAWIDIEDHANLVEDLDIVNFPTVLIQYHDRILFFGTMLPDVTLVHRLLTSFDETVKDTSIEDINPTIQNSDYPLPVHWSLRNLLLSGD